VKVRFLDIAEAELGEAIAYYDGESAGLGQVFLLEVLSAIERIRQFPHAWHPLSSNARRWRTRRFPFGIIYQASTMKCSLSQSQIFIASQIIGVIEFARRELADARGEGLVLPSGAPLADSVSTAQSSPRRARGACFSSQSDRVACLTRPGLHLCGVILRLHRRRTRSWLSRSCTS
jgi:toxin ParE2